ncbi:MAG: P-loop NTPase [archaeon]
MIDPREAIIGNNLEDVKRIIAVSGGKGGIGKSVVASTLALALAKGGKRVGLLDLDLTSPSTHLVLGAKGLFPEEKNGVIPPKFKGIEYMTINYYARGTPSPFRGEDVTNAIVELLAITKWGELDYLIIDMPPGLGDAMLDVVRYLKGAEFLILTMNSKLAAETARKVIGLLKSERISILGIAENMSCGEAAIVSALCRETGVTQIGAIPYDPEIEASLGDAAKLEKTAVFSALAKFAESLA